MEDILNVVQKFAGEDVIKLERRHKLVALIRAACGIAAVLPMLGCASSGHLSQAKLLDIAQNSSCENPYILKYAADDVERRDLSDENGRPLTSEAKADLWHTANVQSLGYKHAAPVTDAACDLEGVRVYEAALTPDTSAPRRLYVKPMTAEQIMADPTVTCKPTSSQVYQPPLKLGGTGKVIQVSNGEECEHENKKSGVLEFEEKVLTDIGLREILANYECNTADQRLVWLPKLRLQQIISSCEAIEPEKLLTEEFFLNKLAQQANLGSKSARYHYAQFLVNNAKDSASSARALTILEDLSNTGHVASHMALSEIYRTGKLFVGIDLTKATYHREQAGFITHMRWVDEEAAVHSEGVK